LIGGRGKEKKLEELYELEYLSSFPTIKINDYVY